MEIRTSCKPGQRERNGGSVSYSAFLFRCFALRVLLFAVPLLAGCGAPGEPVSPSPPIPVPITDLAAHQLGDGVQLTFTLPAKTITGDRLAQPPAVEILRGSTKPDGSADAKSFRVVYTIPGSLTDNYLFQGHLQFNDPIEPGEIRAHSGSLVAYLVRTRASKKRSSADSNIVSVRIYPVPERISSITTNVTETTIELNWPVPTRTSGGDPLAALAAYRVYRGELDPSSTEAASKDLSQAKWRSPLTLLASPETNSYRDTLFDFGKTYLYVVRSVVLIDGNPLESSDSAPAVVAPRDIFPPAAPQNVVAAALPGATPGSFVVDLSWSINVETDLAGYRVYRSEQEGTQGQSVTPDLLPTPAYRDRSVEPGHRYWYTVTAVDRAGNESVPSAPVVADLAKPSP